jgi:cytochrome c oxidase cbb3-type subunit 3
MKNIKYLRNVLSLVMLGMVSIALGQDVAPVAAAPAPKVNLLTDVNFILTVVAIVLVGVIYLLAQTTYWTTVSQLDKLKDKSRAVLILVLLAAGASPLMSIAQDAAPATTAVASPSTLTYVLLSVVAAEILVIMMLGKNIIGMVAKTAETLGNTNIPKSTSSLAALWDKLNNFKPIEREAELETGHDYDGIRELDNNIPSWFTAAFVASIIFAVVYLWRYHIAQSAPLQIEEYNIAMEKAELEKEAFLKTQGSSVDENNVTLLGDADIAKGKEIFTAKCTSCHGAEGNSMPNGVGPNLSDDYWIHGNDIKDIFKTIKYGYVEKGMLSWKDNLSATQIAQVSSFVKSIDGKNIAGGKEPQGEKAAK